MNPKDKKDALNILNFLCKGATIEGVNFYGPKLLLSETKTNSERVHGQVYLNIESEFCLYQTMPKYTPHHNELPKLDLVESAKLLCELSLKEIIKVSLHDDCPHLFLTFDSGEVLFIWGHHQEYESWQVGSTHDELDDETWLVVACPGNELAVWGAEDVIGL
ncbi:hypothetical protein [Metabacillus litoralis]|uniref:hypothetical protein n=1 Tax=Metabacillus litoralis TaxID=152268 RepID=UPI001CFF22F4|nr:hypothetical protein [Metabacillus litoralis]